MSCAKKVPVYNLSLGKVIPEHLSKKQCKKTLKNAINSFSEFEVIKDFNLSHLSLTIKISADDRYIFATGMYRPQIRCFDTKNRDLKFTRHFDAEPVTFELLDEDYKKLVVLQSDRYLEIHKAGGKHCKFRVPRFGRDIAVNRRNCDLYVVGSASDIYRFNLNRGQFYEPYPSDSNVINKCCLSPVHNFLTLGGDDGVLEVWDPRTNTRCARHDIALYCFENGEQISAVPSITALGYKNDVTLGVGVYTGAVLLFDVRKKVPFAIKKHPAQLPIKNVAFHHTDDLCISTDSKTVQFWSTVTGDDFLAIKPKAQLNDLCCIKNSGMFLAATDTARIQTYFIPDIGSAPSWCSFADNIIEEFQNPKNVSVDQSWKKISKEDLEDLKLENLVGTKYLRANDDDGYDVDMKIYLKKVGQSTEASSESKSDKFSKKKKNKVPKGDGNDAAAKVSFKNGGKVISAKKRVSNKHGNNAATSVSNVAKSSIYEDERFAYRLQNDANFKY